MSEQRPAPAKVNLALHVTGRRADHRHDLDTLVVFADVGEKVTVAAARAVSLSVGGRFAAHAPAAPDNLVWRAAALLRQAAATARGAHIHVEKAIPAGAGLGGGSADAAATLLALNDLWETGLSRRPLGAVAGELGADVPMCLESRALRARGTGAAVTPLDGLPPLPLVLVWPGTPLPTAEVFAALESANRPPLPDLPERLALPADLAAYLVACRNDLEEPALRLQPSVKAALQALHAQSGCLIARMSGSGSAVFGLFASEMQAHAGARRLAAGEPGWWVRAATAR